MESHDIENRETQEAQGTRMTQIKRIPADFIIATGQFNRKGRKDLRKGRKVIDCNVKNQEIKKITQIMVQDTIQSMQKHFSFLAPIFYFRSLSLLIFIFAFLISNAQSVPVNTGSSTAIITAKSDSLTIGPAQRVTIDYLRNDIYPCAKPVPYMTDVRVYPGIGNTRTGTGMNAGESGLYDPDKWNAGLLEFKPLMVMTGYTVVIKYRLSCGGGGGLGNPDAWSNEASIIIKVRKDNYPVNEIFDNIGCLGSVGALDEIDIQKKLDFGTLRLDGFSGPLVADINGDGKPEIIALGLSNATDGEDYSATGRFIHVFNGQTGVRIHSVRLAAGSGDYDNLENLTKLDIATADRFVLRSISATQEALPLHNSPGHIAVADVDGDGLAEIFVTGTGYEGKVFAIKPKVNAQKQITGFDKYWAASAGYRAASGAQIYTQTQDVYGSGMPYIADLDGDGVPELIVYNKIYDATTGVLIKTLQNLHESDLNPSPTSPPAGAPTNNTGNIDIATWIADYAYVGRMPRMRGDRYAAVTAIADFGDGKGLSIAAGSKVYNKKDGGIILGPDHITTSRLGLPNEANIPVGDRTIYLADGFTTVADIDGDGALDVIVYNIVDYSVPNSNNPNSAETMFNLLIYVWDPIHNPTEVKAAMLLHINGEHVSMPFVGEITGHKNGQYHLPDFGFVTGSLNTKGKDFGYAGYGHQSWDYFASTAANRVIPIDRTKTNITDTAKYLVMNGDTIINMLFNQRGHNKTAGNASILGFVWDKANNTPSTPIYERLKLSFAQALNDESQATGVALFDFNSDGRMDLCYKDETSVNVSSPAYSGWSYIPLGVQHSAGSNKTPILLRHNNVYSSTGFESPVIADVNMDGSADIITMNHSVANLTNSYGHLYMFEHRDNTPRWNAAPAVWNQVRYQANLIHADLSVPVTPLAMTAEYTGSFPAGDYIYPYNSQWAQQSIVLANIKDLKPQAMKPDPALVDNMKVEVSGGNLSVTLTITNHGGTAVSKNTPISFYSSASASVGITGATIIATQTVGVDMFPRDTVVKTFTLTGSAGLANQVIWARIVDDGTVSGYAMESKGFPDCITENNTIWGGYCTMSATLKIIAETGKEKLCPISGAPITLTANINLSPIGLQVQWYKILQNSVKEIIPGATGAQLFVTEVGRYCCVVTGVIGGTCKYIAEYEVEEEPLIVHDDRVKIYSYEPVKIRYAANDFIPAACTTITPTFTGGNNAYTTSPIFGSDPAPDGPFYWYKIPAGRTYDTITYTIGPVQAKIYIESRIGVPDNIITDATCAATPPTMDFEIKKLAQSDEIVSDVATPLVGDIDGDGEIEILVMNSIYENNSNYDAILIFGFSKEHEDGLYLKYKINVPLCTQIYPNAPMAIARVDGRKYASIFYADASTAGTYPNNSRIRKFDLNPNVIIPSYGTAPLTDAWDETWAAVYSDNRIFAAVAPLVTDLMGNGNTQVLAANSIIDTQTGNVIAKCTNFPSSGRYGHAQRNYINGSQPRESSLIAIDIDNHKDGLNIKEIIGGNCVYKVNLVDCHANVQGNTYILDKRVTGTNVGDGGASVADIDNDGKLDVIVSRIQSSASTIGYLFIYDPAEGTLKSNVITNIPTNNCCGGLGPSRPFVGDFDGDGVPEIALTGMNILQAYKYTPSAPGSSTGTIAPVWTPPFGVSDRSASTTLTVFDFAQDKKNRLVYRDEATLRILDASGTAIITNATIADVNSPTVNEFPVVADVNGDGSAEIIVTGRTRPVGGCTTGGINTDEDWCFQGRLMVFASGTTTRWAAARKVWNQTAYNAVNINEDLTVPPIETSPAQTFPGDGGGVVRPYNGFLMQQTTLNKNGTPLWLTPRGTIVGDPNFSLNKDGILNVRLTVENDGSAAFAAPFKITVYKNDHNVQTNALYTYLYPHTIAAGETVDIEFSFNISNIGDYTSLVVRINDAGTDGTNKDGTTKDRFPDQLVCNTDSPHRYENTAIAVDDYATVFANSPSNWIDVTDNDINPCTTIEMSYMPKHGDARASVIDPDPGEMVIIYEPLLHFTGRDSLKYRLVCNGKTSEATVYITVVSIPSNVIDDEACAELTDDYGESFSKTGLGGNNNFVETLSIKQAGNASAGLLVGDIDSDGMPEIISYDSTMRYVRIYNAQNGTLKADLDLGAPITADSIYSVYNNVNAFTNENLSYSRRNLPSMGAVLVKTDKTKDTAELIVIYQNRTVCSWILTAPKPALKWKVDNAFVFPHRSTTHGTDCIPQPVLADFNGDGVPEIVILNKIYNAATGEYLGQTEPLLTVDDPINDAYVGRSSNRASNQQTNFLSVADFDGDGLPEIAAGGKIYKVVIGVDGKANCSIWRHNTAIMDGFTSVADINLDGKLDVVVVNIKDSVIRPLTAFNSSTNVSTYGPAANHKLCFVTVWTPETNTIIDRFQVYAGRNGGQWYNNSLGTGTGIANRWIGKTTFTGTANSATTDGVLTGNPGHTHYHSYPSVGYIGGDATVTDGKQYPSIVVGTAYRVSVIKYSPDKKRLQFRAIISAGINTPVAPNITLFNYNYNPDGDNAIILRTSNTLFAFIKPDVEADIEPTTGHPIKNGAINPVSNTSYGFPGMGYPVIADTDGDGSANIIVTAMEEPSSTSDPKTTKYREYIQIYETHNMPWGPARTVWNQVNFDPTRINEDLTVPAYSVPKHTKLNNAYPFNSSMAQVPTVDKDYNIYRPAPDPAAGEVWAEMADMDHVKIIVTIVNKGVKNTNARLPVTIYGASAEDVKEFLNNPGESVDYKKRDIIWRNIKPGESDTVVFVLPVTSELIKSVMSVRIQDGSYNNTKDQYAKPGVEYHNWTYSYGSFVDCDRSNNAKTFTVFLPIPDYITTETNKSIGWDLLGNDLFGDCERKDIVFDTIPRAADHLTLQHGTLTFDDDPLSRPGEITYTPDENFIGFDSVDYTITCNGKTLRARAYFLVTQQWSQDYYACLGSNVKMGVTPIEGISYEWIEADEYNSKPIDEVSSNTLTVKKDNIDHEWWYVEPYWEGHPGYPIKFPHVVANLYLSDLCGATGTLPDCYTTGTLVFREDFGGASPNDPKYSSVPTLVSTGEYGYVSGESGYVFQSPAAGGKYNNGGSGDNSIAKGNYGLLKAVDGDMTVNTLWKTYDDYSYPSDPTRGYMMLANTKAEPGLLYQAKIGPLCDFADLYISAAVSRLKNTDGDSLRFVLQFDRGEDEISDTLAQFFTYIQPDAAPTWRKYGFHCSGMYGRLILSIYSHNPRGVYVGNALVIDNVEVRLCLPEVIIEKPTESNDTIVCIGGAGATFTLTGSYHDNGTLIKIPIVEDNPSSPPATVKILTRWEYSKTGDVNNPDDWAVLDNWTEIGFDLGEDPSGFSKTLTGLENVINSITLKNLKPEYSGYYRLVYSSGEVFPDGNEYEGGGGAPDPDEDEEDPDGGSGGGIGGGGPVGGGPPAEPETPPGGGGSGDVDYGGTNMERYFCRAMSRVIHLEVVEVRVPRDIRVYLNPTVMSVQLGAHIDTLKYKYTINWSPAEKFVAPTSHNTVDNSDPQNPVVGTGTGTLNVSTWSYPLTNTYTYTIGTPSCGTFTAKAYVHTLRPPVAYNRIDTVRICLSHSTSATVNISQIIGLAAPGATINAGGGADDALNLCSVDIATYPQSCLKQITVGIHAGTYLFDAVKAVAAADSSYQLPDGSYKFLFDYSSVGISKRLALVVENN